MARPKTPREVKRRRGTLRKDRDPQPLTVIEPAINEDDEQAHDFIKAAIEVGADRWLGVTDGPTIEMARRLWDDVEMARDLWRRLPFDKDAKSAYVDLNKELRLCLAQLGFDPTARARLGVAEVKARSTLDALEARRAKRRAGRRAI